MGIQPAGSAKMAPCHPRSPNRPRSRSVSGCGNASASVGRAWPPSRCAFVAGSPTRTANSKAARSCRCAGSGMPARPAVGALRSTSLAETAMRTRYCQAGYTLALLRRRSTAPAGCTSMIPAPGRSLRLQPLADHVRTSIDAYLVLRIVGSCVVLSVRRACLPARSGSLCACAATRCDPQRLGDAAVSSAGGTETRRRPGTERPSP
jgi:hypothetical protein